MTIIPLAMDNIPLQLNCKEICLVIVTLATKIEINIIDEMHVVIFIDAHLLWCFMHMHGPRSLPSSIKRILKMGYLLECHNTY